MKKTVYKELNAIWDSLPSFKRKRKYTGELQAAVVLAIDQLHTLAKRAPGLVSLKADQLPARLPENWYDEFLAEYPSEDEANAAAFIALGDITSECARILIRALDELRTFGIAKSRWATWQGRLVLVGIGFVVGFLLGAIIF